MLVSFFLQVILPILVEGMKLFPIMLVAFKFEFQTRKRILIITSIFLLLCGIERRTRLCKSDDVRAKRRVFSKNRLQSIKFYDIIYRSSKKGR